MLNSSPSSGYESASNDSSLIEPCLINSLLNLKVRNDALERTIKCDQR
jgi:hypothetical protein